MKPPFFKQILRSFLAITLFGFACYGQIQTGNQPSAPQTEAFGENDRLPFMQTDEAANSEPGSGGLVLRTLGAMILIVGLIFFGAWGLKKTGFGNLKSNQEENAPDLAILSSVSLGSGRTISTVRFGERILLVGSTAQTFTLLADETEIEPQTEKRARSVAELLAEESGDAFAAELAQAEINLNNRKVKGERI